MLVSGEISGSLVACSDADLHSNSDADALRHHRLDTGVSFYTWEDANRNGKIDPGEPPLAGVMVHAIPRAASPERTGPDGRASTITAGIAFAAYAQVPEGYMPTTPTEVRFSGRPTRVEVAFGFARADTPTPTPVPSPTSTPTTEVPPTSTIAPTPGPSAIVTISPTPSRTTAVPSPTPFILLPAPALIEPQSGKCLDSRSINLHCKWAPGLGNGQWFVVSIHALDCPGEPQPQWPPDKTERVRDNKYTLEASLAHLGCNYKWQVVVIREREDGIPVQISALSEEWSFW